MKCNFRSDGDKLVTKESDKSVDPVDSLVDDVVNWFFIIQ